MKRLLKAWRDFWFPEVPADYSERLEIYSRSGTRYTFREVLDILDDYEH